MLDIKNHINRENFSAEVKLIILRGAGYLDAIMEVKDRHQLLEVDIPRLLDDELQSELEKEMVRLKMIDNERK